VVAVAASLGACSDGGDTVPRPEGVPAVTASPVVPATAVDGVVADNEFVPDDVNLGDCVSSLPRPGCGSESRTSGKTVATLGVLMAGMAFIGWRVVRGVRRRDAAQPGS